MSIQDKIREYVETAAPKPSAKMRAQQKKVIKNGGKMIKDKLASNQKFFSGKKPADKKSVLTPAEKKKLAAAKRSMHERISNNKILKDGPATGKKVKLNPKNMIRKEGAKPAKTNPRTQALKDKYAAISKQILKLTQDKAKVRAALEKLGVKFRGRKSA